MCSLDMDIFPVLDRLEKFLSFFVAWVGKDAFHGNGRKHIFADTVLHINAVKSLVVCPNRAVAFFSGQIFHCHRGCAVVMRMFSGIRIVFVVGNNDRIHSEFDVCFDNDYTRLNNVNCVPDPVVVSVYVN